MSVSINTKFDAVNWKGLISQSTPKAPKASHPYICFNKLTKQYFLSDDAKAKGKLSLREICKITKQNLASLKNDEGDIRTSLESMQQRSAEKLNNKFFFIRALVKVMQSFNNAVAGLGFKNNSNSVNVLCQNFTSKQSTRSNVQQTTIANSQGGAPVETKPASIDASATVATIANTGPSVSKPTSANATTSTSGPTLANTTTSTSEPTLGSKDPVKDDKTKEPVKDDKAANKEPVKDDKAEPKKDEEKKTQTQTEKTQQNCDLFKKAKTVDDQLALIVESLGKTEKDCTFEGIAALITKAQISELIKANALSLKTQAPSGYDPLVGFKRLSYENLKHFINEIFADVKLSEKIARPIFLLDRLLKLIDQCDEDKKSKLFIEIAIALMEVMELPAESPRQIDVEDALADLTDSCEAHVSLVRYFLAIDMHDGNDKYLKRVYENNPKIFAEALKKGLPNLSTNSCKVAQDWYNAQEAAKKKASSSSTTSTIDDFEKIISDPAKVKGLDEKSFVDLCTVVNQKKSGVDKEALLTSLLSSLDGKVLTQFLNNIHRYNDNAGVNGPFMTAVIELLKVYVNASALTGIHKLKAGRVSAASNVLSKLKISFDSSTYPWLVA